jgi:FkbM family methyltransferase
MSLRYAVHRLLNASLRLSGRLMGLRSLPSYFNGRWVCLPRPAWPDVLIRYEPYLAAVLDERLPAGGTFVDVGAHHGLWSVYAARRVGRAGRVLAVEPSPAYQVLEQTARLYPVIRPVRAAAGAGRGEVSFYAQGEEASTGSLVASVTAINERYHPGVPVAEIRVSLRTLDDVVAEAGCAPSLVKIDVEGYELEALRGAPRLLADKVPFLVEVHPRQLALSGGSEDELMGLFSANGYAVRVLYRRNPNSLYTVFAEAV